MKHIYLVFVPSILMLCACGCFATVAMSSWETSTRCLIAGTCPLGTSEDIAFFVVLGVVSLIVSLIAGFFLWMSFTNEVSDIWRSLRGAD